MPNMQLIHLSQLNGNHRIFSKILEQPNQVRQGSKYDQSQVQTPFQKEAKIILCNIWTVPFLGINHAFESVKYKVIPKYKWHNFLVSWDIILYQMTRFCVFICSIVLCSTIYVVLKLFSIAYTRVSLTNSKKFVIS